MHFVGMLAFRMTMDLCALMILSVAVHCASALALFVVSRPVVQIGSLISCGIAMAAAINGMHYIECFRCDGARFTGILISSRFPLSSRWSLIRRADDRDSP